MNFFANTILALLLCGSATAGAFELSSKDIAEGQHMSNTFEFSGWGCKGSNLSPQLAWSNAPAGTKSFAITVYDPDAPTGSGFWHWIAIELPASVSELPRGADVAKLGARQFTNDYGANEFGGACPPVGDGMHRYQFTVWALPVEKMEIPDGVSPAVVGFNLNAVALDKKTLTATYNR